MQFITGINADVYRLVFQNEYRINQSISIQPIVGTLFFLFLILMRKISCGFLMVLIGLITACDAAKNKTKEAVIPQAMLVHPLYFQEEVNSLINFPFWFNDSIVRAQKIQSILWTNYGTTEEPINDLEDSQPFPKKTIRYTFNASGKLIHLQLTDFAEGIIISHQSFSIVPTTTMYSYAKQLNNSYGVANSTNIYLPIKMQFIYQVYGNIQSNQRLHYVVNSSMWGGLAVDSLTHPKQEDWIVLGKPTKPEKRYRVFNMVKEKQVTTYSYYRSNFPKEITNDDYPFTRKRSFVYAKTGQLAAFIDSTFIDQLFVTRGVHRLILDSEGRLVRIVHRKGHSEQEKAFSTTEKIAYTFVQKSR